MMLLQTILAFFVVLGTLVVIHELGHFLVARWCGVKVLRFSVGMGKVIFSRRFGPDQTEWAISILPLGGYVKMLDAREQGADAIPAADLAREFTRQSVWKRIAIVAAGPLANFLLAIALYAGLFVYGIPEPVTKLRAVGANTIAYQSGLRGGETVTAVNGKPVQIWSDMRWQILQLAIEKQPARLDVERVTATGKLLNTVTVPLDSITAEDMEKDFLHTLGLDIARPPAILGKVADDGPAARAGLREGDLILDIDGQLLVDGLDLIELVRAAPSKTLQLHGRRDAQDFTLAVTPDAIQQNGQTTGRIQVGLMLAPEMMVASDALPRAVVRGVERTWDTSVMSLKMIGKMIVGEVSLKNITGPITIADYAGQTARAGVVSFVAFMALISISLGVMNLLPIPVLDGGLLLYYSLEVLTGRPVPERFGEIAQRAGAGILMLLMVVAVFNDVSRLLS